MSACCEIEDPEYVHFRLPFMGTYRMGCVRRWNIPFELRSN